MVAAMKEDERKRTTKRSRISCRYHRISRRRRGRSGGGVEGKNRKDIVMFLKNDRSQQESKNRRIGEICETGKERGHE